MLSDSKDNTYKCGISTFISVVPLPSILQKKSHQKMKWLQGFKSKELM